METLKQIKQSSLKQKLIETLETIPEENFVEPIEINHEIIQGDTSSAIVKCDITLYLQVPIEIKFGGTNERNSNG